MPQPYEMMETSFGGARPRRHASREEDQSMPFEQGDEIDGEPKKNRFDQDQYATRKTVASSLMDVALLSANACQMKICMQLGPDRQDFYHILMILLSISVILQLVAAVIFIILGRLNVNSDEKDGGEVTHHQKKAGRLSDAATGIVFLITFVNVLISAFGVSETVDVDGKAPEEHEQQVADQPPSN